MKLRDVIIDKDLTIEMLFYKHVDNNFSLNMKIILYFICRLTGKIDKTHSSEYYIKDLFVL